MTRLELPLLSRRLKTTGDEVVRAELNLDVKTDQNTWEKVRFLVDSGTEMTSMSAAEARKLKLPIPKRPVPGLTYQGQEVRPGLLRAQIAGMDATEYLFPCYFLGDPALQIASARNLLGLTGVINQVRFTFDGAQSPAAPWGILVVEKR